MVHWNMSNKVRCIGKKICQPQKCLFCFSWILSNQHHVIITIKITKLPTNSLSLYMKWCAVSSLGRVLNDQTSQDHNLHRCQGVHHCSWAETHRWRNSEENTWRPEALQSMLASKFAPVIAKVQSDNWRLKSFLCNVLSLLTIESYQSSFLTSSIPPTNALLQVKLNSVFIENLRILWQFHFLLPRMTSC